MKDGEWHEITTVPSPWTDITGAAACLFYAIRDGVGVVYQRTEARSWRSLELPGASGRFAAIATSNRHPDTLYASYDGLQAEGRMWFGVAKSRDFGRTWALVWKESDKGGNNIRDAWLTPTFGPGWSGRPLYLGVAPSDADVCYATDMGRTMRTTDGGRVGCG